MSFVCVGNHKRNTSKDRFIPPSTNANLTQNGNRRFNTYILTMSLINVSIEKNTKGGGGAREVKRTLQALKRAVSVLSYLCVFSVRSPETYPAATRGAIVTDRSWHVQMEGSFLAYEWPTCTETLSEWRIFMGNIQPELDAQLPRFMQISCFNWPKLHSLSSLLRWVWCAVAAFRAWKFYLWLRFSRPCGR